MKICEMGTLALSALVLGLFTGRAGAGVIEYHGEDIQTDVNNPSIRTNSDAAAASFDAAAALIGQSSTIDFETAPLGTFSNLLVAPGVTINGIGPAGSPAIFNAPGSPSIASLDGTNTTAGGSQFVEMKGGTLTFTFAQPTQFFGAYLTGIQDTFFNDTVNFSDGTSQSLTIDSRTNGTDGETVFLGFTDAGASITSVTIAAGTASGGDFIGVDDVRYQVATPLPSSLWGGLVLLGGVGLVNVRRRLVCS